MNRWRIAGLILVAALAAWLMLRSCTPEKETAVHEPTPVREVFHASKPLRVVVTEAATGASDLSTESRTPWLERELRYLLVRGQMRVAAIEPSVHTPFTLRVEMPSAPQTAVTLKLVAPDGATEREKQFDLPTADALPVVQAFAGQLPGFLGAAHATADWAAFIGTDDKAAYDTFLRGANELLGANGRGFTQPLAADSSVTVDRLESLTRRKPRFARAWALLSMGYLSLGGEDEASLTQIAESTAERALALDPALTDAQSALGLVRLRRGEWVAALEHFQTALAVDANAPAALEGLACLLMDAGHARAALPVAQRAVAIQQASIGANECLTYAQLATQTDATAQDETQKKPASDSLSVAQVKALDALLSGNTPLAQRTLHSATNARNAVAWVDPLLQAAANRGKTSQALQAVTRAASDDLIDPVTEVVCGAALRQADFVFNRMLRLHKQNESVPLRILWLPKTDFLRRHPRFEEIIGAEGLLPFWQDHGLPDICAREPAIYGCKLRPQKAKKQE